MLESMYYLKLQNVLSNKFKQYLKLCMAFLIFSLYTKSFSKLIDQFIYKMTKNESLTNFVERFFLNI